MLTPPERVGEVVNIRIDYLAATAEGPRLITVDLAAITRHCRPERADDLLEDAARLVDDVLARRHPEDSGGPVLSVIRGARD
jgi:hypothetical protein